VLSTYLQRSELSTGILNAHVSDCHSEVAKSLELSCSKDIHPGGVRGMSEIEQSSSMMNWRIIFGVIDTNSRPWSDSVLHGITSRCPERMSSMVVYEPRSRILWHLERLDLEKKKSGFRRSSNQLSSVSKKGEQSPYLAEQSTEALRIGLRIIPTSASQVSPNTRSRI